MSTAAFTICTNSYLAQAVVLAQSVREHAPKWTFYIGLADTPCEIPGVNLPEGVRVIPAAELADVALIAMAERYNVIEFCTALKPSYFRTLFARDPLVDRVHYLDPDTVLYSSAAVLDSALDQAPISLTPHQLTPSPLDGQFPAENLVLNHGVFNLGYLGLRRGPTTQALLHWWEERMREYCRIDLLEGYFVDQLWFNLVPIYFPEAVALRHPGVNVAFWNLHERSLTTDRQIEHRGQNHALVLFHFSGFSPDRADHITRCPVRTDVAQQPGLRELLADYHRRLLAAGFAEARGVGCSYTAIRERRRRADAESYRRQHPWRCLMRSLRQAIPESVKRTLR